MRAKGFCWGLALGVLAGCGDSGGSGETERFELTRTEAGELPALLGERGGCRFEVVSGSVELRGDETYSAGLRRRRLCPSDALGDSLTAADTVFLDGGSGTYLVEGDSVFFRYRSGGSAGFGLLAGDSLVVRGPGQTLYYRRQR